MSPGRVVSEEDTPTIGPGAHPRAATEGLLWEATRRDVRGTVVRLPPSVHGAGDHGFIPMLIEAARREDMSAFVDKGTNRWPAVHRLDAAKVFVAALEKGRAGARFHAVAEEGIPMNAIARVIGEELDVPMQSVSVDDAKKHFGWMAQFAAVDCPASSAITRKTFGWEPHAIGLLDDMRENYFGARSL